MYNFMALISFLIREFAIPNPFETLGEGLIVRIGEAPITLHPLILNLVAEPIMYAVTYSVVGLYYKNRSEPALGSMLYLLFYCVHTFLLWLMSLMGFVKWSVVLVLILYAGIHFALINWRNRRI